jgi:hypothetical protein
LKLSVKIIRSAGTGTADLKVFEPVVQTGGMNRAAAELHTVQSMSPPARHRRHHRCLAVLKNHLSPDTKG